MLRVLYISLGLFLIALAVMQNLLWPALIFIIGFTVFFGSVWLVPLAMMIDGYFSAFAGLPLFSLFAVSWYVFTELLALKMRIIN